MKKVIFNVSVHSFVDVITNSSTELFTGKCKSKELLHEMIKSVYPNYLREYEELKGIDELTPSELDNYFYYRCSPPVWPATKYQYPIPLGFTFEELYEQESDEPSWNGELQYRLKNNIKEPKHKYHRSFVTEENIEEIKNKIDPERKMYFLYSIDDNPDWEYQEKLEEFMDRHHMG